MTLLIITHTLAFLLGAGGVLIYLHKHSVSALAISSELAADVAKAKADLVVIKAKLP